MSNVTLKHIHKTTVAMESNQYYMFLDVCSHAHGWGHAYVSVHPSMCVCACARACMCAWVGGWMCVHKCRHVLAHLSSTPRTGIILSASTLAPPYFLTLSHKQNDFQKNSLNIRCVFWFCSQLSFETSHSKNNSVRHCKNVKTSSCKVPVIFLGF